MLRIDTIWRQLKWVVLCFPMAMLVLLVSGKVCRGWLRLQWLSSSCASAALAFLVKEWMLNDAKNILNYVWCPSDKKEISVTNISPQCKKKNMLWKGTEVRWSIFFLVIHVIALHFEFTISMLFWRLLKFVQPSGDVWSCCQGSRGPILGSSKCRAASSRPSTS